MKTVVNALLMFVVMTLLLGLGYPLGVWAVASLVFPYEANGSLITSTDGKLIGSELIGQQFAGAGWFHSRPSAAGHGYDAAASSGSNYAPTSRKLIARVADDANTISAENGGQKVPADLVTTSASGLDPHISPAAAEVQVDRIARERGLDPGVVRGLVAKYTESRTLGFIGEQRVNVLKLNLALASVKEK